ncbi:hypothetical protein C8R42DRAFT_648347 [Lentinula raphanica]|nr:hypothetical protein C8R42DRAFT_648347 [Lentinula raphanica]
MAMGRSMPAFSACPVVPGHSRFLNHGGPMHYLHQTHPSISIIGFTRLYHRLNSEHGRVLFHPLAGYEALSGGEEKHWRPMQGISWSAWLNRLHIHIGHIVGDVSGKCDDKHSLQLTTVSKNLANARVAGDLFNALLVDSVRDSVGYLVGARRMTSLGGDRSTSLGSKTRFGLSEELFLPMPHRLRSFASWPQWRLWQMLLPKKLNSLIWCI